MTCISLFRKSRITCRYVGLVWLRGTYLENGQVDVDGDHLLFAPDLFRNCFTTSSVQMALMSTKERKDGAKAW